jgi:predicted acylesterase/phospholipase RssA/CRP-like cAMP-binding protein
MCIVLSGSFEILTIDGQGDRLRLGTVEAGDVVGEIAVLLGGVRSATVQAVTDSEVLVVPSKNLAMVLAYQSDVSDALEWIVRSRLRRNRQLSVVRQFLGDAEPDLVDQLLHRFVPVTLSRGEYLFREGESGDNLYLVVAGVLEVRAADRKGPERTVARIRRGEPVGEMALISDEPRSASVRAGRQTELLRLSRCDFESIVPVFPQVLMGITRKLVERFRQVRTGTVHGPKRGILTRNIAVVGTFDIAASGVNLSETERIVTRLYDAMPDGVNAYVLTSGHITSSFGDDGIPHISSDVPRGLALDAWLEELELTYDVLFLVADTISGSDMTGTKVSGWTRRCLARADEVLVVADEFLPEVPRGLEAEVYRDGELTGTTAMDLLIVHPEETEIPRGTARLLGHRPVRAHFHVSRNNEGDFRRVARILTGRAVGVALGGGGARGVAHVGALEALAGKGIPVDVIAGTSMGAVVGALWAMKVEAPDILERIEEMFVRRKPFTEYTWPVYGLLRGRRPRKAADDTFGTLDIEDLWIPFVCTSTNLSRQELCVHRRGRIAPAILATTAVPGAAIPPLHDGELHVDGGVLNNLPGDLLPEYCTRVITCDVSPAPELRVEGGAFPSPLRSMVSRRPSSPEGNAAVPTIGSILYSSMTVGSQAHARAVRAAADLSLEPPVDRYGLLDFRKAREIRRIGYDHTNERLVPPDPGQITGDAG